VYSFYGLPMTAGGEYRVKAAELHAKAQQENNSTVQAELKGLAAAYLRLAEQAERNSLTDLTYETPPIAAEPDDKC
jgi:hypothetical protein